MPPTASLPAAVAIRAAIAVCVGLMAAGVAAQPGAAPESRDAPADLTALAETFAAVRARNARDYAVTTAAGVDESRFVDAGGIEQWITIRGEDKANPVVLFLHGGPGDATNPWGYAGFRTWLKDFTVVQWDQRGAGRTFGRHGAAAAASITVERLVADGIAVTEQVRTILGAGKVLLIGHSWGSTLGILMARARPDLFHAFIGTGVVADPAQNYTVAHRDLRAHAAKVGHAQALEELEAIGPPPYASGRGYAVQRKWSNFFEGADGFIAAMFGYALGAPGYTARDVNDWIDGQGVSSSRLVPETIAIAASTLAERIAVPVVVIQGRDDFTTPTSLAARFVKVVPAPRKAFVTIPGGHFAVFINAPGFLNELRQQVQRLGIRQSPR